MKILKKVQNKINMYNEHCEIQKNGASQFLNLQIALDVNLHQPREIDFFFYSTKMKDASNLKSTLEVKGYPVERVHMIQEGEYSIFGTAKINSLKEGVFLSWIEQMNEYAFIHNCKFDGWGMISRIDF